MRKRATPAGEKDPVLVCVESYHGAGDAGPVFHQAGVRLRRSAIAGFSAPYWLPDGADQLAIGDARQRLYDGSSSDVHVELTQPGPMAVCVKPFTAVQHVAGGANPAAQTGMAIINVGDRLPVGHRLVMSHPGHWTDE